MTSTFVKSFRKLPNIADDINDQVSIKMIVN